MLVTENKVGFNLLKKEKVIFKYAVKEKNAFIPSSPPKFFRLKDTYFFSFKGKILEIPNRKKDFLKLFSTKQNKLQQFIGSKKLKINKEEDLLQIISFYNKII